MTDARARVGGRVVTFHDFVPGRVVEGGGELIGSNHPLWVAYAERFDLHFRDVSENEDLRTPIVLGGKTLMAQQESALWEEMDTAFSSANADAKAVIAAALDWRSTGDWQMARQVELNLALKRAEVARAAASAKL